MLQKRQVFKKNQRATREREFIALLKQLPLEIIMTRVLPFLFDDQVLIKCCSFFDQTFHVADMIREVYVYPQRKKENFDFLFKFPNLESVVFHHRKDDEKDYDLYDRKMREGLSKRRKISKENDFMDLTIEEMDNPIPKPKVSQTSSVVDLTHEQDDIEKTVNGTDKHPLLPPIKRLTLDRVLLADIHPYLPNTIESVTMNNTGSNGEISLSWIFDEMVSLKFLNINGSYICDQKNFQMKQLEVLSLKNVKFPNIEAFELSNNLKILELGNVNMIPFFEGNVCFEILTRLSLSDMVYVDLTRLNAPKLEELHISKVQGVSIDLKLFPLLKKLTIVNCSRGSTKNWAYLRRIEHLDLRNCKFLSSNLFPIISSFKSLRFLGISYTNCEQFKSIEQFSGLSNLQVLLTCWDVDHNGNCEENKKIISKLLTILCNLQLFSFSSLVVDGKVREKQKKVIFLEIPTREHDRKEFIDLLFGEPKTIRLEKHWVKPKALWKEFKLMKQARIAQLKIVNRYCYKLH